MKKSIYLLFALFMLSVVSCKQAAGVGGGNARMNDNKPLVQKAENLQQVEEKEYNQASDWTISITSKKNDVTPLDDIVNGRPRKYEIINTASFSGGIPNAYQTSKGIYYRVRFEIQKTIKEDGKLITFVLKTILYVPPTGCRLSTTKPIQIKLSNGAIIDIHNPEIVYKASDHPIFKPLGMQEIIGTANITQDEINKLRIQQSSITVLLNMPDDIFEIHLPELFIEYLKEI